MNLDLADDAKERAVFFDFSTDNSVGKAVVSELMIGEFVFGDFVGDVIGLNV